MQVGTLFGLEALASQGLCHRGDVCSVDQAPGRQYLRIGPDLAGNHPEPGGGGVEQGIGAVLPDRQHRQHVVLSHGRLRIHEARQAHPVVEPEPIDLSPEVPLEGPASRESQRGCRLAPGELAEGVHQAVEPLLRGEPGQRQHAQAGRPWLHGPCVQAVVDHGGRRTRMPLPLHRGGRGAADRDGTIEAPQARGVRCRHRSGLGPGAVIDEVVHSDPVFGGDEERTSPDRQGGDDVGVGQVGVHHLRS